VHHGRRGPLTLQQDKSECQDSDEFIEDEEKKSSLFVIDLTNEGSSDNDEEL